MYDPAIQTINLTKKYGPATALQELNLEVPRESIFAVLGPNGAGKTSLFKILTGLTAPTGGEARVLGYRVGIAFTSLYFCGLFQEHRAGGPLNVHQLTKSSQTLLGCALCNPQMHQ